MQLGWAKAVIFVAWVRVVWRRVRRARMIIFAMRIGRSGMMEEENFVVIESCFKFEGR